MSTKAQYTPYHPKWYRRHVPVLWWLEKQSYTKFFLRELTSIFVALFALVYLWQLRALLMGREAYDQFLARLENPVFLALHSLAFVFVLFHAVTWFHAAPKAMVLRLRGNRVPDFVIVGLNYVAWLIASGAIAWFFLRG